MTEEAWNSALAPDLQVMLAQSVLKQVLGGGGGAPAQLPPSSCCYLFNKIFDSSVMRSVITTVGSHVGKTVAFSDIGNPVRTIWHLMNLALLNCALLICFSFLYVWHRYGEISWRLVAFYEILSLEKEIFLKSRSNAHLCKGRSNVGCSFSLLTAFLNILCICQHLRQKCRFRHRLFLRLYFVFVIVIAALSSKAANLCMLTLE